MLVRLFAAFAVLALLLWAGYRLLANRQTESNMADLPELVISPAPATAPAEKPTASDREPRTGDHESSERNGAIMMDGLNADRQATLSTIRYPGDGESVGKLVTVRGSISRLAPNQRAFLCVKSKAFGRLIYPQGELLPTENGQWSVSAIYASVGYEYETFVVIAESSEAVKGIDASYSRLYGLRSLPANSFVASSLVTVVRR